MNATQQDEYWDNFDGPNMACNFDNGFAEGYEAVCTLVTRGWGTCLLLNGFAFFYNSFQLAQLATHYASMKSKTSTNKQVSPTAAQSSVLAPTSLQLPQLEARSKTARQFARMVATNFAVQHNFCLGILFSATALSLLISGHGISYPSTSIRGLVGDWFGE
jgi:hypothetical protein